MINPEVVSSETVGLKNRLNVLRLIKDKEPISRAEIAKEISMSASTVTTTVNELINMKVVKEGEFAPSTGGRKPRQLKYVTKDKYVLGIDLGAANIRIVLSNLKGDILKIIKGFAINEKSLNIFGNIKKMVDKIITETGIDYSSIITVGVCVSGVVNHETGELIKSTVLGLENIAFRELLEKELNLKVVIENDVNAAALAEKFFGKAKDITDFIFLAIGAGIGAGIIINNQLFRGYKNLAGEIGYLIVDESWLYRKENTTGCLESLASDHGIVNIYCNKHNDNNLKNKINAKKVFKYSRLGDKKAKKTIEEVIKYLAIAILNISVIFSPQMIVLGGEVANVGDDLIKPLKDFFDNISPVELPPIVFSEFSDLAGLKGATSIAVNEAEILLLSKK